MRRVRGVAISLRVAHEVEGCCVGSEVDGVREDATRGSASVRAREGHREAAGNERFIEVLQVGIIGYTSNWVKCLARCREDINDIGQTLSLVGGEHHVDELELFF